MFLLLLGLLHREAFEPGSNIVGTPFGTGPKIRCDKKDWNQSFYDSTLDFKAIFSKLRRAVIL